MGFFQTAVKPAYNVYTVAYVYVNASLLLEEAQVNIIRTSDSKSAYTLSQGYAGEILGAPMIELSVTSNVPSTNFELDPFKFIGVMQKVNFTIVAAQKSLSFSGFIIEDNFSHAVNNPANLTFKARGYIVKNSTWT